MINYKTQAAIDAMRLAGKLTADVLTMISDHVKPGITTNELDKLCHDYIVAVQQAIPGCLNYRGYTNTICSSVNHQVCHGIPSEKKLKEGDIVNIDITVLKNGYYGDSSKMFIVGKGSILAEKLVRVTQECLYLGIEQVKPGAYTGDIGAVIQKYAEKNGFSVVRDYCGHGIGQNMHEDPSILHYGKPGDGVLMHEGMTFTIEPMINAGKHHTKVLPDGWTVVTKDHSLSAQWEHTILVTSTGFEVLTRRDEETF